MRAVLVVMLAAGCGFRVGGTAQPDGDVGDDVPIDAPDVDATPDAPIDAAIDAPRSWWDDGWGHRRSITIDGTQLADDLVAFPILIKIPAADLMGVAQNDCDDLRFVELDDDTVATYQLDTCGVADNKDTLVWLKRSLVHTSTTTLWLYYGNGSAPKGASDKAVFGSDGANYLSVYHLGGSLSDASGNAHTLTAAGNPGTIASDIGDASTFDGNGDYYKLGQESDFDFTTTMSVSAWIEVGAFTDDWQAIVAKADDAWRLARAQDTDAVGFGTTPATGPADPNLNGTKNVNDGAWHHLAIVFDSGTKYLYVDGVEDAHVAFGADIDTNGKNVRIGSNETYSSREWNGQIDEVRISGVSRSAAWIAAEHLTVTSTSFVQIGSDESH